MKAPRAPLLLATLALTVLPATSSAWADTIVQTAWNLDGDAAIWGGATTTSDNDYETSVCGTASYGVLPAWPIPPSEEVRSKVATATVLLT